MNRPQWIQRDLEDLIEEAKREMQMTEQNSQPAPKISLKEVKALLSKGYTRYKKDDKGYGSIQEKFGLSYTTTKTIFAHPRLKGLKTVLPGPEIVDDLGEEQQPATNPNPSTSANNLFD